MYTHTAYALVVIDNLTALNDAMRKYNMKTPERMKSYTPIILFDMVLYYPR